MKKKNHEKKQIVSKIVRFFRVFTFELAHSFSSPLYIIESTIDRFNVNISFSRNWEHLQTKFVGTGHPDITKYEWATNMQRDMLASHLGHEDMIYYCSVAENQSIARTRYDMLEKMIQPCGVPPVKEED